MGAIGYECFEGVDVVYCCGETGNKCVYGGEGDRGGLRWVVNLLRGAMLVLHGKL